MVVNHRERSMPRMRRGVAENAAYWLNSQRIARKKNELQRQTLKLVKVGRADQQLANQLASKVCGTRLPLAQRSLRLALEPHQTIANSGALVELRLTVNGQPCWLGIDERFLREQLQDYLPLEALDELPAELRISAVEAALDELLSLGERVLSAALAVTEVSLHPPAPPAARLCFRLEQEDGQHYRVHCSFGSDLQAYLLALLEGLPYRAARDWQWLPVALHFEIGCTQLAAAQLRELALGDLILLDDYSLARDQSLTIRLAGGVFYTGKLNGKSITVQSIAETIMNEVKDAVHDTAKIKAISISELPIHLAFDLGEKTIPLRELKAIQPGYIFELDKTPEKAVAIRVEGRRIGAGELVQIEERIGVRVLELYSQFDE